MKSAVIVFPGSNCDRDVATVLAGLAASREEEPKPGPVPVGSDDPERGRAQRQTPEPNVSYVWHGDARLPKVDLVVVPGGFSYGDYLRSGAMAAHSPVMREVVRHADAGGLVLGICNGFQILTEAGMLPGTLLRNAKLKFLCRDVHLRVENADTPFTKQYSRGQVITVPIAHHDGNYFADAETLRRLENNGQVAFRYSDAEGGLSEAANPNGSAASIAGVFNERKNVLGLMPHPERCADPLTGGIDGLAMFEALVKAS